MAEIIDLRQKELFNDYVYETEKDGFLKDVQKYSILDHIMSTFIKLKFLNQTLNFTYFGRCQIQLILIFFSYFNNNILVILFFFQIPFIFAYQPLIQKNKSIDYQFYETFALNFAIAIFVIDIALTFNIAYYKQGYLVSGRKQIAINYIKTYLILDLIPLFCLIEFRIFLHQKNQQFGIEIFLFILKIYEVFKTSNMIQIIIKIYILNKEIFVIIKRNNCIRIFTIRTFKIGKIQIINGYVDYHMVMSFICMCILFCWKKGTQQRKKKCILVKQK